MYTYILKCNNRKDTVHLCINGSKFTVCGFDTVNLDFKTLEKFKGNKMHDFQQLADEYKKQKIYFCTNCFKHT